MFSILDFDSVPWQGEPMLQVELSPAVKAEIDKIFQLQKSQADYPSFDVRIDRLNRLGKCVKAHIQEIEAAIQKDLGRHPTETDLLELVPVFDELKFAIKNLKKWMRPQRVGTPLSLFGTKSELRLDPKGVVLIISPWNYPFSLGVVPLVAALAAGNRVLLKPSELAPETSNVIAKIIKEAFNTNEVAVFLGDHQVSNELLKKPFDHIFFTGSTRVGKIVMEAAAKHLASVTLELGGKSPAIVDTSADIAWAAKKIVWGKFSNAGQTCVAPDYVLVPKNLKDPLVAEINRALIQFYTNSPETSPEYARIVSPQHLQRLSSLVEDACEKGARVLFGGRKIPNEKFFEPTALSHVTDDMKVMQEEIFGPVLPILEYDDLPGAIEYVRNRPNPLALYVFSRDKDRIEQVLKGTSSGGVSINETMMHVGNSNLPFGGAGESGLGNQHGYFGYRAFSNERAVLRQTRWHTVRFFYPPFTERKRWFTKLLLRFLTRRIG
jgi:aldehyde dehydrogenase (NAD+)